MRADFTTIQPRSVRDALLARRDHENAVYLAGGTDLFALMRHEVIVPGVVIDLGALHRADGPAVGSGSLFVPASSTIAEIAENLLVRATYPVLAYAASVVASPPIRNEATLGGNVMLDTRCNYVNRDAAWRHVLGGCLKKDGTRCHVTGGNRQCVAARCGDTVAPLLALDARIEYDVLEGDALQTCELSLRELYSKNGGFNMHTTLPLGALVRTVVIPPQPLGLYMLYRKCAPRLAIDFPTLSVAVGGIFRHDGCESVRVVVSAISPKPRYFSFDIGAVLTDERIEEIAQAVWQGTHPLKNVSPERVTEWRRHMVRIHVIRSLCELRSQNK